MKLNFWQIIGVILLIVAVVLIVNKRMGRSEVVPATNNTTPGPVSSPITAPSNAP